VTLPNYIVIRPASDLPPGFLPPHLDGRWFDGNDIPHGFTAQHNGTEAVVVPTGRFEVRESDGAVAEVYEMRP
jgi:hypothetical protein